MRIFTTLSLLATLTSPAAAARFETRRLAVDGDVISLAAADLDGDGKRDLVVAYRHGLVPTAKRFIGVFWNDGGNFSPRPNLVLPVDESICAYDVADVDGRRGDELITITHDGLSARGFAHRAAAAPVTLTREPTLFDRGDQNSLPRVAVVQALGGAGSHELVVPLLGAIQIYRSSSSGGGESFTPAARLEIDVRNQLDDERRANPRASLPAFNLTFAFPAVEIADTDGDGLRDVLVVDEDRVAVFRQKKGLAFDARPSERRNFEARTPAERQDSFSSATVHVADLDGDGVADLVVQKQVTHGITSAVTTHYIYLGRRGGGWDDKPNQVMRAEGLGGIGLELIDVTGDGHPDLVMPTVSMGVWQIIRVLTTKTLKVNLQVFAFDPAPAVRRFADKATAERELKFHVALSGEGDLPAFDLRGDYNGDKRRDLAFGDETAQIGFFVGEPGGHIAKDAAEHASVTAAATIEPIDLDGKGKDDLVLHYSNTKGHRSEVVVLVNRGPW
jgi:hypothetical protein